MKLLLFGASGSGTTTLAKVIAEKANFMHLDADDYYWKPTEIPFTEKIPLQERNKNIKIDFQKYDNVVISGSMVSWGKEWETAFDLAVFIRLDNDIRMERLRKREIERYGGLLDMDTERKKVHEAFMDWANQYENPQFKGRSLQVHNDLIKKLDCPVIRINGEMELEDKMDKVVHKIREIKTIK